MSSKTEWFAIKTMRDFKAEGILSDFCAEVFFPKRSVKLPNKQTRNLALIPHVLFIRTTRDNALVLEAEGRNGSLNLPFWIYRYPSDNEIQIISEGSIHLLRLLTAEDTSRCRIFTPTTFKEKEHVRITGGIYEGYQGFVQRIQKNKHVVVRIEGVCMVVLPFIHPDLLESIDPQ